MATKTQKLESGQDFAPDRTAQALLNLRCAVDHCHDAIFIADSTGKIEFVNAAFEVLTGYTAQEANDGGLALFINSNPARMMKIIRSRIRARPSWKKSEKRASTGGRYASFAKMDAESNSIWQ